jgi:hypothetical protein
VNCDIDSLDTGPDWLTVTAQGFNHVERLRRQADRYIHGLGASHPWRWLGYVGRRYHDAGGKGGTAYGEKGGGELAVFQAWGALASLCGTGIITGERFWMPGDSVLHPEGGPKVTRCDLQVTVLHKEPTLPIRDILDELPSDKHHFSAIVPLDVSGGTLYIGHRSSDIFGRLYDKGAQMGGDLPPRMLWRYEVEYKRAPAAAVAAGLWGPCTSTEDRRGMILTNVEAFFRERGLPVPFTAPTDTHHSVVRFATRQEDAEKTLRWLTQQVQPAILRLSLEGNAERVAEALGLCVVDGVPSFESFDDIPTQQIDFFNDLQ